ncbi:hypothetical protein C8R47DRAFT_84091 [Mycena vitilis]|nr:hypothetical protein C8R47DRAFT_84091 [Mycena vitilis]
MPASAVKLLLGPILIGVSLNTLLYGVCVTQFVSYYSSTRRLGDSRATRLLVAWELLINTAHSAIAIYYAWLYMVDNFLNAAFLETAPWPLTSVPLFTAMSSCPIQLFLIYRVFLLSKSRYIAAVLVFLTVINGGIAIVTSVLAFNVKTSANETGVRPVTDAWLGMTVANDFAITLALVYYLFQSRTGLSQTDTVINRLIQSAVESAAAATLFAILVMITFTRLPATGLYIMFSLPLGRIYTSTLLSTLNRRESLRQDLNGPRDLGQLLPTANGGRTVGLVVNINQETEMDSLHKIRR